MSDARTVTMETIGSKSPRGRGPTTFSSGHLLGWDHGEDGNLLGNADSTTRLMWTDRKPEDPGQNHGPVLLVQNQIRNLGLSLPVGRNLALI